MFDFPFWIFLNTYVRPEWGKWALDLAALGSVERGKNSGVLRDQGQIYFYGCSADVILLHCFCNLFPCQTQACGFSVARNVASESIFAQACVLVSKNRCAEVLAGHSSGRVSGSRKPHCLIQTGAEVSVRRDIRTLQG